MSVTISADDPRTIRAIEIAAEADKWLVYRDADGYETYRVPSQSAPARYYKVTPSSCDCADFQRVSPSGEQHACKHMLAVRLHRELVRAQYQTRPTPRQRRDHLRLVPRTEARPPNADS
jgi:uncharacterized Zn finger protein